MIANAVNALLRMNGWKQSVIQSSMMRHYESILEGAVLCV